ncbi:MAG: hypothetical protein FWF57_08530 [Defluviitaleaceae bacterium]|nr:hypothetical protein [Defluviitaleaceae bacterium]
MKKTDKFDMLLSMIIIILIISTIIHYSNNVINGNITLNDILFERTSRGHSLASLFLLIPIIIIVYIIDFIVDLLSPTIKEKDKVIDIVSVSTSGITKKYGQFLTAKGEVLYLSLSSKDYKILKKGYIVLLTHKSKHHYAKKIKILKKF